MGSQCLRVYLALDLSHSIYSIKSPARGQSLNKRETMQGKRWRGEYDARETWGDTMGIRRNEGGVNELNMEEGTERYDEERFDFFYYYFFIFYFFFKRNR